MLRVPFQADVAYIGPFASVDLDVLLQIGPLGELFVADVASELFYLCVRMNIRIDCNLGN